MRAGARGYRLSRMTETPNSPQQADSTGLEGTVVELTSPEHRRKAVDLAFDYRGDVTIETLDGKSIEGYIFDRAHDVPEPYLRILPSDGSGRIKLNLEQLRRLSFSGKDTAAGQSWETWIKKWKREKLEEMNQTNASAAND